MTNKSYLHNSIIYNIYYPSNHRDNHDDMLADIQSFISYWTRDYIWHDQEFTLQKSKVVDCKDFMCLCGQTVFGDSVDDEWFIVFLLFQLSLHFQDIIITTCDDDGEFLLIECAQVLPKWIQQSSDNDMMYRVYIFQGRLHIIPKHIIQNITMTQGLILLSSNMISDTIASEDMQKAIKNRLSLYENIEINHYHRAVCIIPKHISKLLNSNPCWISLISKSLVDAMTCLEMAPFEHNKTTDRLVENSYNMNPSHTKALIKFTKLQFSQIYLMIYGSNKPKDMKDMAYQLGLKVFLGYECLKQSLLQGESFHNQKYSYQTMKVYEQENDDTEQQVDIENGDSLEWLYEMIQGNHGDYYTDNLENITKNFEEFSKKVSGYQGIETDDTSSYDSNEELEILDVIRNDPDLLMKIVEKSEDFGLEYKDIILKLQSLKTQDDASDTEEECWSTDDNDNIEEYFKTMDQEINTLFSQYSTKKRNRDNIDPKSQIFVVDSDDSAFQTD